MELIKTLKEANQGVVEETTNWEWAVHNGPANNYQYVTTEGHGMFIRIKKLDEHPSADEFKVLRDSGITLGAIDQIGTLYFETKFNFTELLSRFDFSADGKIDFSNLQTYMIVNTYYHNAILSAERFVTQTETIVSKVFGKDSKQAAQWRTQKHDLLKRDLSFGYCLEERNHIQHVLKPLSLINLDPITKHGGLGINLESDYTDYDRRRLPKEYKHLRDDFIQKRTSQGRRPFLSIAGMLPTIQMSLIILYLTVIELLEDCVDERINAAAKLGSKHNSNGLLIIPSSRNETTYTEPRRILCWGSTLGLKGFKQRCKQLDSFAETMSEDAESFKHSSTYKCILP